MIGSSSLRSPFSHPNFQEHSIDVTLLTRNSSSCQIQDALQQLEHYKGLYLTFKSLVKELRAKKDTLQKQIDSQAEKIKELVRFLSPDDLQAYSRLAGAIIEAQG